MLGGDLAPNPKPFETHRDLFEAYGGGPRISDATLKPRSKYGSEGVRFTPNGCSASTSMSEECQKRNGARSFYPGWGCLGYLIKKPNIDK
jgi:hypothetical protein